MQYKRLVAISLGVLVGASGLWACQMDTADPGEPDEQVLYRWDQEDTPSSAERGSVLINEIMWAGSVDDDGNYDPDDVFVELRNEYHRPVNLSGWRLIVRGDYEYSLRLPDFEEALDPNDHLVIAAKEDGAFGEVADVIDERLKLGKRAVRVQLRDYDHRLIEAGGSETDRPFAGGYDLVTARSMERTQALFDNNGTQDRSWTANIDDITGDVEARSGIREGWRQHTLASPGEPNSADYSGATAGGGFD